MRAIVPSDRWPCYRARSAIAHRGEPFMTVARVLRGTALAAIALAASALTQRAHAQQTGTVRGTVTDWLRPAASRARRSPLPGPPAAVDMINSI